MWGLTWVQPTSKLPSMMKTCLWPRGRAFPCATSARARAWNLMPTPTSRDCSTCSGARLPLAARVPSPRWALTGQAESLVALGEDMRPVMNAISWMDERSTEECAILAEAFPERRVEEVTGQMGVLPTWPASKILWLRRHRPELFAAVHKYALIKDYVPTASPAASAPTVPSPRSHSISIFLKNATGRKCWTFSASTRRSFRRWWSRAARWARCCQM